MKNRLPIFLTLIIAWGVPSSLISQTYNIYFGDIHSQTWYSDGNKDQSGDVLSQQQINYPNPVARAITYARDVAGNMDFLGVSDHNHNESLNMTLAFWRKGVHEADSVNQDGTFVGLYGQEWGVISNGGHVLVYGTDKLFGWDAGVYDVFVPKYYYGTLFDSVKKYNGFCYLAHPQSSDYKGQPTDAGGIFTSPYNANWDSVVVGTALKNGPALDAVYNESDPASGDYEARYHDLLKIGYHVAPCGNQDNHYTNFGMLNQQRTAVLASSLTRANILDALRNRRAYATEDHNLQVRLESGVHVMGQIFTTSGSVPIRVKAVDTDGSNLISRIEIRYGVPGSGTAPTLLSSVNNVDSLVISQPQLNNTTYYYYAYVLETNGRRAWTAPMWITTTTSSPSAFSQTSPNNASTNQAVSGTLTWQASVNASQYDVYLDTSNPPTTLVSSNQAGTSYNYSGLLNNTLYYWKVVAENGIGSVVATGAPWSFTTIVASPGTFALSSPPDNATSQPLSGSLVWNSSPNAANYDVMFDTNNPPTTIVASNTTDSSYAYSGLSMGITYYWKVVAKNVAGSVTASNAPRSFTAVNVPQAPSGPVSNNITTNSLDLSWTDNATDETGYRIYRSTSAGGPFGQLGGDLPANSVSFSDTGLNLNQQYYYRVVPFNGLGEGNYGAIEIATLAQVPGVPALSNVSYDGLLLVVDPVSNPAATQFAIRALNDSDSEYIQANGKPGASPSWRTFAEWGSGGGTSVTGLHSCKQYMFHVEARNLDNIETAFGGDAGQTTNCFSVSASMLQGWNLLSLPVGVTDRQKSSVFPASSSSAFAYQGAYVTRDILSYGAGYWLKFSSSQPIDLPGDVRSLDSISVNKGWNMIGSISASVPVGSITTEPAGIVVSPFYSYDGVYHNATSIDPMSGYWVKASVPGKIILAGSPANIQKTSPHVAVLETNVAGLNSFTFEDGLGHRQILYIGKESASYDGSSLVELPPVPPAGFDVRFSSQRTMEVVAKREVAEKEFPIAVQATDFPVKVSWNFIGVDGMKFRFKGKGVNDLEPNGNLLLTKNTTLILQIQPAGEAALPKEFALHQNYPNPFNPSTEIRFDLPTESHVELTVYNVLGVKVATLVDGKQESGFHRIEWLPDAASGLYFYRLEASRVDDPSKTFQQVKRMLLMK